MTARLMTRRPIASPPSAAKATARAATACAPTERAPTASAPTEVAPGESTPRLRAGRPMGLGGRRAVFAADLVVRTDLHARRDHVVVLADELEMPLAVLVRVEGVDQ